MSEIEGLMKRWNISKEEAEEVLAAIKRNEPIMVKKGKGTDAGDN